MTKFWNHAKKIIKSLTYEKCEPVLSISRHCALSYQPRVTFEAADGLKYYDIVEGKGPAAENGSTVQVHLGSSRSFYLNLVVLALLHPFFLSFQVHFDCIYRGITAVSSRESKLLAGNRIIAQVLLLLIFFHLRFLVRLIPC